MPTTRTLLIVDDCIEDRKIYRRYLLQDPHQSYRIWQVDSAEEGLVLCRKIQFDALVLDFCLPEMNGLQFLDRLKEKEFLIPKAVIVLTGHGDEEVAVQALKWGVQDYLIKQQLKADVLQLTVRNAIEKSHLQAQLNKTLERQRLIATTSLRIRQSLKLEDILHTAVTEVQQLLKCDRVAVYQIDPDLSSHLAAEIAAPVCEINSPTNLPDICWQSGTQKNWDWSSKKTIANVYAAGLSDGYTNLLEQAENKANLVIPIAPNSNGDSTTKIWGLLVAHQCAGERQWQADEVAMLHEVSVQLAIAIQQAELLTMTQAALAKEKQLSTFKSQIVATVSHEYRTPLASILAAASTLKQHGDKLDEEKQEKFLQIIEDKARKMSKLVDDMLLVNKIELDKTKFKPVTIDLLQFFEEQIAELRSIASECQQLSLKVRGNIQNFSGDRGLLRLILDNLISNALKYSTDRSDVEVNLTGKNSCAIFSVKDRGIGIPKQELTNLFQCFYRASNVGTIPGTGLGLAIVKACVDLHGGEISLNSKLGQGTKVTVSLPKQPDF